MTAKHTAGVYDAQENILHLWYPHRVELATEAGVRAFFDEVLIHWIRPCPTRPYLLVNYANVTIASNLVEAYAQSIRSFQPMVLGTFRYGVPADFTGVAVAIGNMRLSSRANIYPDEASARAAIRRAKEAEQAPR